MKALFLHNPTDLNSTIAGGVQICSKQFLDIIKEIADELYFFEVNYNKSLVFRILYRLNLDAYQSYSPKKYKVRLVQYLLAKEITHIFINKAELIKFSKIIKEAKLQIVPKIIIMSHGNESGDLLGDLTGLKPQSKNLFRHFGILKLGLTLYLESWYRKRYVDLVCTMSEEENAIEKWLGVNSPLFIPRLINQKKDINRNPILNVFGYVGTLNHTPNIVALNQLCEEIKEAGINPEIRIIGGPDHIGKKLANKYPFIKYLGALNDDQLQEEVRMWAFFLNPIFNYSRGASMKLAKAIEWEIPVITTTAGRRGYLFDDGKLIETDNTSFSMVNEINNLTNIPTNDYETLATDIVKIKHSMPTATDLGYQLNKKLEKISKLN